MDNHNEGANAKTKLAAAVARGVGMQESADAHGRYEVECRDKNGNLKWIDTIDNVVTTVGKNDNLDTFFAGSGYTAAWYIGLISLTGYTSGPVAGDTMASHSGWTEDQNYSEGTRPAPSWGAAAAGSKATTATGFSIDATTTIKGCFMNTVSTKGGTTGNLYSAGLFTGGDKAVADGDTLNVTWTGSL